MTLNNLKLRLRTLFRRRRVEAELDEELAFHIDRETHKLIDQGMAPEHARASARARFGSAALAADQCRDERGTAVIDNTVRDVQYAWRTFAKAPAAAFTIVATVAVGLGVVAVLFTILNAFIFRVDDVPDVDAMYAITRTEIQDGAPAPLTRRQLDALRDGTSAFDGAYGTVTDIDLHVDGRTMAVTLVTGNFLDVVRVAPAAGRGFEPADDAPSGGRRVLLLSDKGWLRHFDRDPNVLGRTVLVNGAPFVIVGVMPPGFRGLEVSGPDVWAPFSQLSQFRPADRGREDDARLDIIGRLKPGLSRAGALAELDAWNANLPATTSEPRETTVDLQPHAGTLPQPLEAIAMFAPLFVAFGLVLMIGCANVANLLLARGVARQREIGIRLSLGASRRRIVRQLITESVLLGLMAAVGGFVISRLLLEGAVAWTLQTMPVDLGDINVSVPAADWRVALFLVIGAIVATAFFAVMPALRATAIDPVRTLRGQLVRDARPGRTRNILIGLQAFASALLLITAAIFLRSAVSSSKYDSGFRTTDTVLINVESEASRARMIRAIGSDPTVVSAGAVRPQFLAPLRLAVAGTEAHNTVVSFKSVSGTYFDVLGLPVVRGRAFLPWERDQDAVAIVSESLARTLWPDGGDVGQPIRLDPDAGLKRPAGLLTVNPNAPADEALTQPKTVIVVGIVGDVPGFRMTGVKEADVFLPTALDVAKTSVVARVRGDATIARATLVDRLTAIDPNMGTVITLQTVARLETLFLDIAFWVAVLLGGLALLLTVSGLFSVLSFLVEQQSREIGVRMALGASRGTVTRLMLGQTLRPVAAGLVAGAALVAAVAAAVLASPAGALISPIVRVSDPVAYFGSLAAIVAACLVATWIPAARAAAVDPMRTLRQD